MNKKKKYIFIDLEIISFANDDVVITSNPPWTPDVNELEEEVFD